MLEYHQFAVPGALTNLSNDPQWLLKLLVEEEHMDESGW